MPALGFIEIDQQAEWFQSTGQRELHRIKMLPTRTKVFFRNVQDFTLFTHLFLPDVFNVGQDILPRLNYTQVA